MGMAGVGMAGMGMAGMGAHGMSGVPGMGMGLPGMGMGMGMPGMGRGMTGMRVGMTGVGMGLDGMAMPGASPQMVQQMLCMAGAAGMSGASWAVNAARDEIDELTQEELPIEVQQTLSRMLDEVIVVHVPANRVGKLIGSRGAVIQGLRQETGVVIDLQKDDSGAATVTLRGPMEAMCAAKAAIESIMKEDV